MAVPGNPYKLEVQRQECTNTALLEIQRKCVRWQIPLWPTPTDSRPTLPCTFTTGTPAEMIEAAVSDYQTCQINCYRQILVD